VLALGFGLMSCALLYVGLAPTPQLAVAQGDAALVAKGQELYNTACVTCHGSNLQGVNDHGPSLIGVGQAAVYFQVGSGRMPLARQEAQAGRKPPLPKFDPGTEEGAANLEALEAYVQANGGGPVVPAATGDALRGDNPARGGELFRLNCASCHNFVGEGGALSSGKMAPSLQNASDLEIYTAMLTGPENMPVFGDNQLTPEQKRSVINYVQTIHAQADPGGAGIGRIGPVSEGLVIWVVGIGVMLFGIFWMGSKA
jgi:ubiquinol-cytochrome c reductase cytochrome c subunit